MAWGLIALGVGFLYGWLTPGQQDKAGILKTGLIWGLILGVIFAVLGFAVGSNPFFLGSGSDLLGFVVALVIIVVLFVIGVWVGDLFERKPKRTST